MEIKSLKKILYYLAVFSILLFSFSAECVENSIIPTMEKFESLENLSQQKYSHEQFKKIQEALKHKHDRIRVATYNMLFNIYDNHVAPENRWPQRLPRIVDLIDEMNPDVIGSQELEPDQVADIMPFLKKKYRFFSINSLKYKGEQDGIFFKKDRFKVIKKVIFIMKPTSVALTMVQLKDRKTGKSLAVCNTHLTFSKIENRTSQAHFIAKKVKSIFKHMPVIFMGDLNTFPNRPDMGFPALDGDYVDQILTSTRILKDSINVSKIGHVGPIATFTNDNSSAAPFFALI